MKKPIFLAVFILLVTSLPQASLAVAMDEITQEVIDDSEKQFVGTLFLPKACHSEQPCHGIVTWAGSGGNAPDALAKHYAEQGYATLSIRYFTHDLSEVRPGYLPHLQDRLPLETFERAIRYLRGQSFIKDKKVAIVGGSRGGEAALLAGVHYADLLVGVVAHRPSNYVWSSRVTGTEARNQVVTGLHSQEFSSWTLAGEEIPYIPMDTAENKTKVCDPSLALEVTSNSLADFFGGCTRVVAESEEGESVEKLVLKFTEAFLYLLRSTSEEQLNAARIPVERISVPLYVSGGDHDAIWPAARFVREIEKDRTEKNGHPLDRFVIAEDAGHSNNIPSTSPGATLTEFEIANSYMRWIDPTTGQVSDNQPSIWPIGGDRVANHKGNQLIMESTLMFLQQVFSQD